MSNDAARLGAILRAITNKCRICGCEGDSCSIGGGEKCMWLDELKTLCNSPHCIQVAEIRDRQYARQKRRRVRLVKGRVA